MAGNRLPLLLSLKNVAPLGQNWIQKSRVLPESVFLTSSGGPGTASPRPPPPLGPRVRTTAGEVFWAASLLPPFEAKTDPSCSCGVSLQLPPQEEQII